MPARTIDISEAELESAIEPRIFLPNVSWEQYESMLLAVGKRPRLRLTYLEDALEIMTISQQHELIKTIIARLLYVYADEMEIDLFSCGSATFKNADTDRGLEPDESFCIDRRRDVPDVAIAVILTSGGIDKLAVYKGLNVPEVWFWQDDRFSLYRLREDRSSYDPVSESGFFPQLDFTLLARYVTPEAEPQAIRDFRKAVRLQ